jgi:hypothetical protein
MHKFIFPLLLLPAISFSQKPSLFKTTKDRFTGDISTNLVRPIILSHGKAGKCLVNFFKDAKGITSFTISIIDKEFGCVMEGNSLVYFVSTDGTKFKAYNSEHKCDGLVILILKDGPAINENFPAYLNANEIAAIRIENENAPFEIDVTKDGALKIKSAANELFNFSAGPIDPNAPIPKKAVISGPIKADTSRQRSFPPPNH